MEKQLFGNMRHQLHIEPRLISLFSLSCSHSPLCCQASLLQCSDFAPSSDAARFCVNGACLPPDCLFFFRLLPCYLGMVDVEAGSRLKAKLRSAV